VITTLWGSAAFRLRTSCTVSSRCNDHTSSRQWNWSQTRLSAAHSRDRGRTPCSPHRPVGARRNGHIEPHSMACANGTSGRERVALAPPNAAQPTFRLDDHRPVMWWDDSHIHDRTPRTGGWELLPQEVRETQSIPDANSRLSIASLSTRTSIQRPHQDRNRWTGNRLAQWKHLGLSSSFHNL
jgi:hypothetical protein